MRTWLSGIPGRDSGSTGSTTVRDLASGQVAQVPFHLNRAMDNGLTKAQASEVLTHLGFYAVWPNVFSAVPVVKGVFESRVN
jgi:4-carboxymuconolactone decarboxylase